MRTGKTGWKKPTTVIVIVMSIAFATLSVLLYGHASATPQQPVPTPIRQLAAVTTNNTTLASGPWQSVTVKRGDTLASIFSRLKISQSELLALAKQHKEITSLRPGDVLYFHVKPPHELTAMKFPRDKASTLLLTRNGSGFVGTVVKKPTTTALSYKSTVIHASLARAAKAAGFSPQMVHQLQTIFGGTVNFARDIHSGDRVAFLYQEYYVNGKKYRTGDIVAAEMTHLGHTYHAVRFTYPVQHTGYYTPTGQGVEARYLLTPLHYKRISSYFNLHRLDPILHRVHPHLGIDYAAQEGTPIKSIGEGRIVFMGREGGYGKTLRIRYSRHDVALYGHLWRFAKNVHLHQYVHKGEVIGYVGETGWATGPHLHFGFYIDGKPRNWLTLKLPKEQSVPRSYKKQFFADAKRLLDELHLYQETQLAMNNTKCEQ